MSLCLCGEIGIVKKRDPIELEIFKNIFHSIAEEMGAALRRTAFSPNIKERRDYSCAVFDSAGEVIAMGDHMPVHLGSMPMSVRAAIERTRTRTRRHGDAERSLPRRNTFAGHNAGGAGVCSERRAGTRPERTGARAHVRIFMSLLVPITPMSAACTPDRWACAAKFTRKVFAFLR